MNFADCQFEGILSQLDADVLRKHFNTPCRSLYWVTDGGIALFSVDSICWGTKCPSLVLWECVRRFLETTDDALEPCGNVKPALLRIRREVEKYQSVFENSRAEYNSNPGKRRQEIKLRDEIICRVLERPACGNLKYCNDVLY